MSRSNETPAFSYAKLLRQNLIVRSIHGSRTKTNIKTPTQMQVTLAKLSTVLTLLRTILSKMRSWAVQEKYPTRRNSQMTTYTMRPSTTVSLRVSTLQITLSRRRKPAKAKVSTSRVWASSPKSSETSTWAKRQYRSKTPWASSCPQISTRTIQGAWPTRRNRSRTKKYRRSCLNHRATKQYISTWWTTIKHQLELKIKTNSVWTWSIEKSKLLKTSSSQAQATNTHLTGISLLTPIVSHGHMGRYNSRSSICWSRRKTSRTIFTPTKWQFSKQRKSWR